MPECKYCGQAAPVEFLGAEGLCPPCEHGVHLIIHHHRQLIGRCYRLAGEARNADEAAIQLEMVRMSVEVLQELEDLEIHTGEPSPLDMSRSYLVERDQFLLSTLEREYASVVEAVSRQKAARSRLTKIHRLYGKVAGYREHLSNPARLKPLEDRLSLLMHQSGD